MKTKVPILKGFTNIECTSIKVYCPYCRKYHTHSWDANHTTLNDGLRVAHCDLNNGSPFLQTSYIVQPFSEKEKTFHKGK